MYRNPLVTAAYFPRFYEVAAPYQGFSGGHDAAKYPGASADQADNAQETVAL